MQEVKLIKAKKSELFLPASQIDVFNPPVDLTEFQTKVLKFMWDNNFVSLCGNNIGFPYNVIFLRGNPNYVFWNVKIVNTMGDEVSLEETCPNIPGLVIPIKRPEEVRIRYQTTSGGKESKTFGGLTARYIQHSMDYIEGRRFYNLANYYHREKAMKKIRKS